MDDLLEQSGMLEMILIEKWCLKAMPGYIENTPRINHYLMMNLTLEAEDLAYGLYQKINNKHRGSGEETSEINNLAIRQQESANIHGYCLWGVIKANVKTIKIKKRR
jgi:hypothetical protein